MEMHFGLTVTFIEYYKILLLHLPLFTKKITNFDAEYPQAAINKALRSPLWKFHVYGEFNGSFFILCNREIKCSSPHELSGGQYTLVADTTHILDDGKVI